jgi:hypothetical protein
MPQFVKMPAGGTGESQRPTATVASPNPLKLMASSGKVSESGPTGVGADATKVLAQGGQVIDKLPIVPVEAQPSPDGGKGNLASEDPIVSKQNVIRAGDGSRPGRQEPKRAAVASVHRPAPGVINVKNLMLQSQPKKGA